MDQFSSARNVCHIFLDPIKSSRKIVMEDILNIVKNPLLKQQYPHVDENELIAQLEADCEVYVAPPTDLTELTVKPWLNDVKSTINWELWYRYKSYMKMTDHSFPISSLDDVTDKILDKCINPKTSGVWDRRGMVVGNVQSGKTANYTGLINKATDTGYKLIIVLAGIHNSLRSQTQIRIDEGYIGRDSSAFIKSKKNVPIGVGEFKAETEIYSYTSSGEHGDFKRTIATGLNVPIGGKSPTILVIKKHTGILENLILWLNQFAREDVNGNRKISNIPLLVIDDEADNASVNSGSDIDIRSINRLIRTLLNLFNQNTFIGYTATPYANLYIPPAWNQDLETSVKDIKLKIGEDLFPRDFILNIPPPSNYIGAAEVFGFRNEQTGQEYDALDIIRKAEDQEPYIPYKLTKENVTSLPEDIPQSLKDALKSFILVCAIRRLRGHSKKHNSMLVHAAARVAWIDRIAWHVNEILRDYKLQIRSGQGQLIDEIKHLYENDFQQTTVDVKSSLKYKDPKITIHTWEEIQSELVEAVSKIEVRSVHGTKNTRNLEYHSIEEIDYSAYENGLSVIAVGGNKLSRGITLQGLSVSYYLRTTRMYDSLMQMGRWFGYRPGYADLCRVYTTGELTGWYRHVTMATEEMRADFDELASKNLRPADFQLKVRTHPGILMITSVAKMREHEKIQVGFSGKLKQTYAFSKKQSIVSSNYNAFTQLLARLSSPEYQKNSRTHEVNGLLWRDVDATIVNDFIDSYHFQYERADVLKGYIEKQNTNNLLRKWSIAVVLNSGGTITTGGNLNGKVVQKNLFKWKDGEISGGLPSRNLDSFAEELIVRGDKNAILDKRARIIDLDFSNEPDESEIKKKRKELGRPLLVFMPLDPRIEDQLDENTPLIGCGIIFPEFEGEETYEYAARPMKEEFEVELQEDDDEDNDE